MDFLLAEKEERVSEKEVSDEEIALEVVARFAGRTSRGIDIEKKRFVEGCDWLRSRLTNNEGTK